MNAPKQDTANGSHQATSNQPHTSSYSDPLLPSCSADSTNLNHHQPDISSVDVTQLPDHPSSPSGLALAQKHSADLMNDGDEVKLSSIQPEPVRTADVALAVDDPELTRDRGSSPLSEPQSEQPCLSRVSLFSGMELVTRGRPLCERERETSQTDTDRKEDGSKQNTAVYRSDDAEHSTPTVTSKNSESSPSFCNSAASESSQPVSAFTFLKF